MVNYYRHKLIIFVIAILVLGLAPLHRSQHYSRLPFWPYYNWELGFGAVPFVVERPKIFLEQVDDQVFDPPMQLTTFFLHKNYKWHPTKDYAIQRNLFHQRHNPDQLQKVKRIFEARFLDRISKVKVRYHVALVKFDPIVFRKNRQWIKKEIVITGDYVK